MPSALRMTFGLLTAAAFAALPAASQEFEFPDDVTPIDCKATVFPPRLDFEFRYFTGYRVAIPVKQLIGPPRAMILLTTVTPLDPEGARPETFRQEGKLPEVPDHARGELEMNGSFSIGPGRYQVDWLLVDSDDRGCRIRWEVEAKPTSRESKLRLSLPPGGIADARVPLFKPERTVYDPDQGRPLRVKVLLCLDPWPSRRRTRASVRLFQFLPRLAALRALSRHPRIGEVALTAFSVEEQRRYVQHELRRAFDFPGLRPALDDLSPAIVSIEQLGRDRGRDFFVDLLRDELPSEQQVDAYVFLGPDPEIGRRIPKKELEEIEALGAPIFYLNYSRIPWKGLMARAVKYFDGKQIRFADPRELAVGVEKLVETIEAAVATAPSSGR